jgi:hypothetical protein
LYLDSAAALFDAGPQANFATFKTFAWDTGQAADAPNEPVSIVNGQIRTAISGELQQKGYAEAVAGAKPDLLLRYETAAAEKMKSNPVRIGIGVGGAGSNGRGGCRRQQSERQEHPRRHARAPRDRPGAQCRGVEWARVARARQARRPGSGTDPERGRRPAARIPVTRRTRRSSSAPARGSACMAPVRVFSY